MFGVVIVFLILTCIIWFLYSYLKRKPADLSNDLILITGAANGLGRLLVILLSKYCSNIIAIDKDVKGLEETASCVLKQSNVRLICYECDLSDSDATHHCAEKIRNKHGRVTILINNAGIVNGNFLLDIPSTKAEKLIRINLLAPFYLVKEFLPGMLGSAYDVTVERIPQQIRAIPGEDNTERLFKGVSPRGHIVFLSSLAGQTVGCGLADYCASKAALSALAETLRFEMDACKMDQHIFVTDVRPFLIDTGMFKGFNSKLPIFPILKPLDVAKRIVKAIRYRERTVYIPWLIWFIPLIHRFVPYPVLVFLAKISGSYDGIFSFRLANRED